MLKRRALVLGSYLILLSVAWIAIHEAMAEETAPSLGDGWWKGNLNSPVPKRPGIFGELGKIRSERKGVQDLETQQDLTIQLQAYLPGEGGGKGTYADSELLVPKGTRLIWAGEGYGSSLNPPGKFLLVPVQLVPCPESFPKEGTSAARQVWAQFDPSASKNLYFQIHPSNVKRCVLDIRVYGPRMSDRESKAFANSLKVVTGPRPGVSTLGPSRLETPSVDSDSMDNRKVAAPAGAVEPEKQRARTESGSSAK